jgi:hypothetical protein
MISAFGIVHKAKTPQQIGQLKAVYNKKTRAKWNTYNLRAKEGLPATEPKRPHPGKVKGARAPWRQ